MDDYRINRKLYNQFAAHYRAELRHTERREQEYYNYSSYDHVRSGHSHLYTVPCIEITMPFQNFADLVDTVTDIHDPRGDYQHYRGLCSHYGSDWIRRYSALEAQHESEARLRERIPALQKAWEHYQFTLELVKDY